MMKTGILALALMAGVGMGIVGKGWSQAAPKSAISPRAVHALVENARAVQHNAAIYQWDRVNWEVDRIVAAEGQLSKAWAAQNTHAEQATALKAIVHELRAARLANNAERCTRAARDLEKLSNGL